MLSLTKYLECEGAAATPAATPTSTMGAGNPMPPGPDGEPGSGDIPTAKIGRKKKKRKHIAESFLDRKNKKITASFDEVIYTFFDKNLMGPNHNLWFSDEAYERLKNIISNKRDDINPARDQYSKDKALIVFHPESKIGNITKEFIEIRAKREGGPLANVIKIDSEVTGDGHRVSFSFRSNIYNRWGRRWDTGVLSYDTFTKLIDLCGYSSFV